MAQKSFFARRWKLILNLVTIFSLFLVIFFSRHDLADSIANFAHVNVWFLLLLLPIEAINYHAQTKMYQGMFNIVGNKLTYKFLFIASLELNFVNHVFSSAGAAGISYFGLRMKNDDISGAKATLIQVMKLALTFLAFEALLIVGMFILAAGGKVNNLVIMVGTAISTILLFSTLSFIYVVGSKSRINSLFTGVVKILNRIVRWIRPKHTEAINISKARDVFDDFHDNYKQIEKSLPQLQAPFWWALATNVTEVLCIYAVFLAFGHNVNIGAVILAYGVANFAGLVSILPGGAGVYEFLMTAVLASAGIPAGIALPVVIMYRVVNTLIQVPIGYVFYQRNLSSSSKQAVQGL